MRAPLSATFLSFFFTGALPTLSHSFVGANLELMEWLCRFSVPGFCHDQRSPTVATQVVIACALIHASLPAETAGGKDHATRERHGPMACHRSAIPAGSAVRSCSLVRAASSSANTASCRPCRSHPCVPTRRETWTSGAAGCRRRWSLELLSGVFSHSCSSSRRHTCCCSPPTEGCNVETPPSKGDGRSDTPAP